MAAQRAADGVLPGGDLPRACRFIHGGGEPGSARAGSAQPQTSAATTSKSSSRPACACSRHHKFPPRPTKTTKPGTSISMSIKLTENFAVWPAFDHGRHFAGHHVRAPEPRRRRGGGDHEAGRGGNRATAACLSGSLRSNQRRERLSAASADGVRYHGRGKNNGLVSGEAHPKTPL